MIKPHNPPAFPSTAYTAAGHSINGSEFGMTLRDYFAAKALQGVLSLWKYQGDEYHIAAGAAYSLADAMLKARNS
jgi:hypothetical protein